MTQTPYTYAPPHPAIATDIVVLALEGSTLGVLLIERGEEPHKGAWALPGGFLRPDETVEACGMRELQEETGIRAEVDLVGVFSDPTRDPRERVVSIAYVACVDHRTTRLRAASDAAAAQWWPATDLPPIAFDHASILAAALAKAADLARHRPLAARLLPESFTLAELQEAQEALTGRRVDKRNFRREVLEAGWVRSTGEMRRGQHRPAEVWRVG
ncbi:NUDIX hydrolase [Oryzibacter oryziterrae]|uniref:NUDIX hydrolase n=1 Tax=Oryzibacter oryziterrae TaxID=2766474 RepID=UPI001F49208A|nr:NUDIX domain-containing protein [Oryzibacter oryziterrae]